MKIALIGAGSVQFARKFAADILLTPELAGATICLMDTDLERLGLARKFVSTLIERNEAKATCQATGELDEAVKDASAAVVTIRARAERHFANKRIVRWHGLRVTMGDALGPTGALYAVQNAPAVLAVCRKMEALAPKGVVLNYTDPVGVITAVCRQGSAAPVLGLTRGLAPGVEFLADVLDVPPAELDYSVAGLDHCSWYLHLRRGEKDLYPLLRRRAEDELVFRRNPVRFDLTLSFGYFPAETSYRHAECHPYYMRHDEEIDRLRLERHGGADSGQSSSTRWRNRRIRALRKTMADEESYVLKCSGEYCADVLGALAGGRARCVYATVPNDGLIDNLPPGGSVKVPLDVDSSGFRPRQVGSLPAGPAARTAPLAHEQAMVARAIIDKDLDLLRQAILVDPNTAASLTVPQIREVTDELLDANESFLAGYE